MSDDDHTDHDALEISSRRRDKVRARALRAAQRAGALVSSVSEQVAPKLDVFAEWATRPENAQRLQRGLAAVAQVGMSAGFKADPTARLLFEFADLVSHEAGREHVVFAVATHSPLADGSLLDLIQSRVSALSGDDAPYLRRLEEVRLRILRTLCALAERYTDDDIGPPPMHDRASDYVDYFDDAIVPPRYADLAALVAGDPRAWSRLEERYPTSRSRRARPPQSRALARRDARSTEREFRLMTTSYMLFAQAYLTRGIIEELPGLFAAARADDDLERGQGDEASRDDGVIDM